MKDKNEYRLKRAMGEQEQEYHRPGNFEAVEIAYANAHSTGLASVICVSRTNECDEHSWAERR